MINIVCIRMWVGAPARCKYLERDRPAPTRETTVINRTTLGSAEYVIEKERKRCVRGGWDGAREKRIEKKEERDAGEMWGREEPKITTKTPHFRHTKREEAEKTGASKKV